MYDIIIIGTGPAGLTSLLYCVHYGLHAVGIGELIGGKFLHAPDAIDYPGIPNLKGPEFIQNLQKQLQEKQATIIQDGVLMVKKENGVFLVATKTGQSYQSRALIIATGNGKKERENTAEKIGNQLSIELLDGKVKVGPIGDTSVPGVFAAGDCLAYPYSLEQLGVATATGISSAAGVYQYLKNEKSPILWGSSKIPRR